MAPTFVTTPKLGIASIVAADTTTKKVLFTGGANGSKVTVLTNATDDSAIQKMQVWVKKNGGAYSLLGTVPIPALSGGDGTVKAVDMLDPTWLPGLAVDNDGQHYILLETGDTLEVSALATVTAAKTHYLSCNGANI